jgi:hypothetical protein
MTRKLNGFSRKKRNRIEGTDIFPGQFSKFMQIPGVEYIKSFALVAPDTYIILVIAIFLYFNHAEMFDVEDIFVSENLDTHL